MPLVRISLKRGKSVEYRKAITDGVHLAMHKTFNVPQDNRFMIVSEHDGDDFVYDKNYLDVARSDDLVFIQLTVNNTRTLEQKKSLFATMVDNLAANPGLRKEDVFINLIEVLPENWSLGNGVAQYATQ